MKSASIRNFVCLFLTATVLSATMVGCGGGEDAKTPAPSNAGSTPPGGMVEEKPSADGK